MEIVTKILNFDDEICETDKVGETTAIKVEIYSNYKEEQ